MPNLDGIHSHCIQCYKNYCDYEECSLIACDQCSIKLHLCKLEDHLLICLKACVACINECYGCIAKVRRERMALHLKKCPANAVICNYYWCRNYLNTEAERAFKCIARSLSMELRIKQTKEMDIRLALIDQNAWHKVVRNKRLTRIKSRKLGEDLRDSSDEEELRKEEYARNNPFSGCHLCRLQPGSQHFHVLGSLANSLRTAQQTLEVRTMMKTPIYKNAHGLFMELDHFCLDDTNLGIKRGTTHRAHAINFCQRLIHREQAADHAVYHATIQAAVPGFIVQRCPMFENGCNFSTAALVPESGIFRFNDFLGCIVHVPRPEYPTYPPNSECTDQIVDTILPLSNYLDGATIVCLAATNSRIRRRLFATILVHRVIDSTWVKEANGKWIISKKYCLFGAVQRPPKLVVQPLAALSKHLSVCEYNVTKSFQGIEKVELPCANASLINKHT